MKFTVTVHPELYATISVEAGSPLEAMLKAYKIMRKTPLADLKKNKFKVHKGLIVTDRAVSHVEWYVGKDRYSQRYDEAVEDTRTFYEYTGLL